MRWCFVLLAAYAALFSVYTWWLGTVFPSPGKYIGGGIMALVTGGSLGALYNAGVAWREWSLLAAARHCLPWIDGRWTAVAGELVPVTEPIVAPFSGQECVLCEYDVALGSRLQSSDGEGTPGSDFAGFLMNPCMVRAALGELRLLGFPNMVGFGERLCTSAEAQQNARTFLLGAEFENMSGLKMMNVFSAIKSAWSDDDGLVRKNIRLCSKTPQQIFPEFAALADAPAGPVRTPEAEYEKLEEDEDEWDEDDGEEDDGDEALNDGNLEDEDFDDEEEESVASGYVHTERLVLKETRVKVGENVCAFGVYSGEKRGLTPGGLGADHFIKLVRGKPETIEADARSRVWKNLLGGIVALAVVHAGAYALLLAAPK